MCLRLKAALNVTSPPRSRSTFVRNITLSMPPLQRRKLSDPGLVRPKQPCSALTAFRLMWKISDAMGVGSKISDGRRSGYLRLWRILHLALLYQGCPCFAKS